MKRVFLIVIAALVLAACSAAKTDLSGEWHLVSYGDPANLTPAVPGVDTSFLFNDGEMSGNVGCNGFGGEYQLSEDQITFNGIISTMMYCDETMMQEQGVIGVFSDNVALQIKINGSSLTITSADGTSVVNLARK